MQPQLNRKYRALVFSLLLTGLFFQSLTAQSLGTWREYFSYQSLQAVSSSSDRIWAASAYGLISYNPETEELERFGRLAGLAEASIEAIAADPLSGKVVIAYKNGNIDILEGLRVRNIDALKNAGSLPGKKIHEIYIDGSRAYLSADFGILIIDLLGAEVSQTAYIGMAGSQIAVWSIIRLGEEIFAATEEGIKKARANANLQDFRVWEKLSISGSPEKVRFLSKNGNDLYASGEKILYSLKASGFEPIYSSKGKIHHQTVFRNNLLLIEEHDSAFGLIELSGEGDILHEYRNRLLERPVQVISRERAIWLVDSINGLIEVHQGAFSKIEINSPPSITSGEMLMLDKNLYLAAANPFRADAGTENGLLRYSGQWEDLISERDSMPMLHTLRRDPVNGSVWAASYGGGLLNIDAAGNKKILREPLLSPDRNMARGYYTGGLEFDAEGRLWVSSSGAIDNLSCRDIDGSMVKFQAPFPASGALGRILIDEENQKWIIAPGGNGLVVFNHGFSVADKRDDQWKWYRPGPGNGNLPDNDVLSMAVDRNGFIWIGTASGVAIIQCPQLVFTATSCEAYLPLVERDGFNTRLFSGERVQAISVDAANRKWIGTDKGVWLISEEGENVLLHFNTGNSPLASNNIFAIEIDHQSGEVYFATGSGLSSYRADAIEGSESGSTVFVYPNPVVPEYQGPVVIKGVPDGATIRITSTDGRLIYSMRAQGGQVVWTGKDRNGNRPPSGVYLILVQSKTKTNKLSGKIILINK